MGTGRVHFVFSLFTVGFSCDVSPFVLYHNQNSDLRGTATFFFGIGVHSEKGMYLVWLFVFLHVYNRLDNVP